MANNPFTQNTCDLGTGSIPNVSKADIDSAFRMGVYDYSTHKCIYCGNTAIFEIIPKHENLNTAELQNEGFICEHCAKQNYLDSDKYGLRALK